MYAPVAIIQFLLIYAIPAAVFLLTTLLLLKHARRLTRLRVFSIIALCMAWPLYAALAMNFGRQLLGSSDISFFIVGQWVLPSIATACVLWIMTRSRLTTASVVFAASASLYLAYTFEKGTHGPWYIQSEGLALLLSFVVAVVSWQLPISAAMFFWARRIRKIPSKPGFCQKCSYDLTGIPTTPAPTITCPECGTENPPATHS